jgi:hypothetical protein
VIRFASLRVRGRYVRQVVVQEVAAAAVAVAAGKDCSMRVEAAQLSVRDRTWHTGQERTASRKPLSRIVFDVTCTEPVRKSE